MVFLFAPELEVFSFSIILTSSPLNDLLANPPYLLTTNHCRAYRVLIFPESPPEALFRCDDTSIIMQELNNADSGDLIMSSSEWSEQHSPDQTEETNNTSKMPWESSLCDNEYVVDSLMIQSGMPFINIRFDWTYKSTINPVPAGSLGFRRVGTSSWFAFTGNQDHRSRALSMSGDWEVGSVQPVPDLETAMSSNIFNFLTNTANTDGECLVYLDETLPDNSNDPIWNLTDEKGNTLSNVAAASGALRPRTMATTYLLSKRLDWANAHNYEGHTPWEALEARTASYSSSLETELGGLTQFVLDLYGLKPAQDVLICRHIIKCLEYRMIPDLENVHRISNIETPSITRGKIVQVASSILAEASRLGQDGSLIPNFQYQQLKQHLLTKHSECRNDRAFGLVSFMCGYTMQGNLESRAAKFSEMADMLRIPKEIETPSLN
ncbi:hypothetical protein B0H66DRAFT_632270 [Apodospora peruviana]|uniref:Uncharacterized protein n=1 Tax=Apodospora peruviana TaxID=516989 RepID=A0AAE0HUK7_9PEZI|nr:hypothetical protein B0H66DRAFT_632270 [Apodospora peruviana]